MHRGIIRHEKLQLALGRNIKRVSDFSKTISRGSDELNKVMMSITSGSDPNAPVYVFKEVTLNRIVKRSRRADIVFYIPTVALVYVEYKTVETEHPVKNAVSTHEVQLRETHNNLISNLTYKLSIPPFSPNHDKMLPVTTVLLRRRFWNKRAQDDDVFIYSPKVSRGVKERRDKMVMVSILSKMGRLFK